MIIEITSIVVGYVLILIGLFMVNKFLNKKIKLKEYEINTNVIIGPHTSELLELVIKECFNEYYILNIGFKDVDYINADKEDEITKEIATLVYQRLSPALITQLSLYYNIDILPSIISNKVYIFILNFSLSQNTIESD